jgi:protein tyrosine/serine phosphatase
MLPDYILLEEKNMIKKILPVIFIIFICSLAFAAELNRSPEWAVRMQLPGVRNLHKINDNLYRSEQPSKEGLMNLKKMGVKTIINLRAFHSDKDSLEGTKLLNEELSVNAWHIEDEDVIRVLKIIRQKENGPFLIHCKHGADRTGLMSAMYRIVEQGWSKDEAIKEMVEGGYGFHAIWSNIINYVKNADIKKIKKELTE